jgi:hypothetical protein
MPMTNAHIEALIKAQLDIVRLQAHLEHQTKAMEDLKLSQAAQTVQLKAIQELLSEARGGWRMMMLMGGAGAALGGFISWAGQHFVWK